MAEGWNPTFVVMEQFSRMLADVKCDPIVYRAETELRFCKDDPNQPNGLLMSDPLPFRLDTGAQVSVIPGEWLDGPQQLRPFVGTLLGPVMTNTVGGQVAGFMAKEVSVRFVVSATTYQWDFLVSPNRSLEYGLVSLRDVRRHFNLTSDFSPSPTITGGKIILEPRQVETDDGHG